MKKNILIIGGTGFIGKNLILSFKNKNFNIFSLSKSSNLQLFKDKNIKQIKCDITKKKDIEKPPSAKEFPFSIR